MRCRLDTPHTTAARAGTGLIAGIEIGTEIGTANVENKAAGTTDMTAGIDLGIRTAENETGTTVSEAGTDMRRETAIVAEIEVIERARTRKLGPVTEIFNGAAKYLTPT